MRRTLITSAAALIIAVGGVGVANALSGGGDDGEHQATGAGADQARAAALKLIPGGTANAVERDSEDGATWEVEVSKPDGSVVDVRLDEQFHKVTIDDDSETGDR